MIFLFRVHKMALHVVGKCGWKNRRVGKFRLYDIKHSKLSIFRTILSKYVQ